MAIRIRRGQISVPELLHSIDESKLGPNSPIRDLLKLARRKPKQDLEHQEQVRLFAWAKQHEAETPELALLFAVPNFMGVGKWRMRQSLRLQAEGRKPGVPDVWLPVARAHYHGLVIELKAGKNRPTVEQRQWLDRLTAQGYCALVAFSALEAQTNITQYLSLATNAVTPTTATSTHPKEHTHAHAR